MVGICYSGQFKTLVLFHLYSAGMWNSSRVYRISSPLVFFPPLYFMNKTSLHLWKPRKAYNYSGQNSPGFAPPHTWSSVPGLQWFSPSLFSVLGHLCCLLLLLSLVQLTLKYISRKYEHKIQPHTNCVILGKIFNLSVLPSSDLQVVDNDGTTFCFLL